MDAKKIGNIIRLAREAKGWSQADLGSKIGIKQQSVDAVENGATKRSKFLPELATALEIPLQKVGLPSGTGINHPVENPGAKVRSANSRIGHLANSELDNRTDVPEIDVRAGASYAGGFNQEENTIDESGNSISADVARAFWGIPVSFLRDELRARPGKVHILPVRGDSMNDALFDGDRAIINLDDTDVSQGGIFALLDDNSSVIIKQVELIRAREGPKRIKCTSRNPSYEPFELELDDTVKIIGRVASKITRL